MINWFGTDWSIRDSHARGASGTSSISSPFHISRYISSFIPAMVLQIKSRPRAITGSVIDRARRVPFVQETKEVKGEYDDAPTAALTEGSTETARSRDFEKIAISHDDTYQADHGGTRPVTRGIPTTGKQADECRDDASWRSISLKAFESCPVLQLPPLPRSSSDITQSGQPTSEMTLRSSLES